MQIFKLFLPRVLMSRVNGFDNCIHQQRFPILLFFPGTCRLHEYLGATEKCHADNYRMTHNKNFRALSLHVTKVKVPSYVLWPQNDIKIG